MYTPKFIKLYKERQETEAWGLVSAGTMIIGFEELPGEEYMYSSFYPGRVNCSHQRLPHETKAREIAMSFEVSDDNETIMQLINFNMASEEAYIEFNGGRRLPETKMPDTPKGLVFVRKIIKKLPGCHDKQFTYIKDGKPYIE